MVIDNAPTTPAKLLPEGKEYSNCLRYIDEDVFLCADNIKGCNFNQSGKCSYILNDQDMSPMRPITPESEIQQDYFWHTEDCRCIECVQLYGFRPTVTATTGTGADHDSHSFGCVCFECLKRGNTR